MSARYDEIPEAYKATYEWVFQSPPPGYRWDDFRAHLTGQDISKPYFIYGKPGCGKSTLMKFIALHKETESLLAQWAGKDELTVVKFFSWNVGVPLQKNQTGMLRTFMHTILKKHPELIPTAFPEIYNYWDFNKSPGDPTHAELASSFKGILEPLKAFSKILVILDGIDEFEGDHRAVSEFIYSLPNAKVKVIVSSRPINASLSIFKDCPALRLQDLTKNDMDIYVRDQLDPHPTMVQLIKVHPKEHSEIVFELQEKAEGVFLWVKLVVGILIRGIDAGDDIWQLQEKLRLLPNDLKTLYRRMFEKMPREYQVQAAKIFRLKETGDSHFVEFSTLLLYFALQPPRPELTEALDLEALNYYHNTIVAQIRNHCSGFLEIHPNTDVLPIPDKKNLSAYLVNVSYIHRTVHEFMHSEGLWNELLNVLPGEFDPSLSLASACLRIIRVAGLLRLVFNRVFVRDHMQPMFVLLPAAMPQPQGALNSYIDTFDQQMKLFQETYGEDKIMMIHSDERWLGYIRHFARTLYEWSEDNPKYQFLQRFNTASLAVLYGIPGYLETYFNKNPEMESLQKLNLVMVGVDGLARQGETPIRTFQFVLRHIDQSKETCCGRSFFKITLDFIMWLLNREEFRWRLHRKALWIGIVLGCFITASSAPANVIREYRSHISEPHLKLSDEALAVLNLLTVIKKMKEYEDAEVRVLGDQVEAALQKCEEQDREEKEREEQERKEKEREELWLEKQTRKELKRSPWTRFHRKGKPDHTSANNHQEPEVGLASSLRRLKLIKRT
jgi:hypothetical protein